MRKMAADKGIEVVSAGTAGLPGFPASQEAIAVMGEEGIDISAHRSQPLDGFLLEEADQVYVMTDVHLRFITSWFKSIANKVRLVREVDTVKDDDTYPNVPDPLGSSVDEYRKIRDMLKRVITELHKGL